MVCFVKSYYVKIIIIILKFFADIILSATGNGIKEKTLALDTLHSFITVRKKLSSWSKVYETLMKRHLELCIDLKNPHYAKDGLHQYRNLCQVVRAYHSIDQT
jgi:hypothetical protein